MTEKLRVVDHHIDLVSRIIGDTVNVKVMSGKIEKHYREKCDPNFYKFTPEYPLENFVTATIEIAAAMMGDNIEPIPDFTDETKKQRNFDKICFNCPNYENEGKSCRLDRSEVVWTSKLGGNVHLDTPSGI